MPAVDQATLLALLRGLHLASILSLQGVVGFLAFMLPATDAEPVRIPLLRLWWISGAVGLLTGLAWFALLAAAMADATDLSELTAALPLVAGQTHFGRMMLVRGGLVLAATLLAGRSRMRQYPALLLIAVALGLQGEVGHAGALESGTGDGIVASEAMHLIAAGLWLGALVPLWLTVGRLPAAAGAAVCERFSPIGLACVLVIAGTGLAQGAALIGSLFGLVATAYGRIALLKITLFLLALLLALLNRLWLTDRLSTRATGARRRLRLSLLAETAIGLAIILAAGFLASSAPAVHVQPVWPIPWRFSW